VNCVGYGDWMHIDGGSESVIEYIRADMVETKWLNQDAGRIPALWPL
jgi:hypothetical protein